MTNFVIETDVMEMSESIITRENIDKQLNHYATLLTVLMALKLKEKFEEEDDKEFDSDAESLIDTDDTWTTSDDDSDEN